MHAEKLNTDLRKQAFIHHAEQVINKTTTPEEIRDVTESSSIPDQAPSGTNEFFLQYDGLEVGDYSTHTSLLIHKEEGCGDGSTCVDITLVQGPMPSEKELVFKAHVRSDDSLQELMAWTMDADGSNRVYIQSEVGEYFGLVREYLQLRNPKDQ